MDCCCWIWPWGTCRGICTCRPRCSTTSGPGVRFWPKPRGIARRPGARQQRNSLRLPAPRLHRPAYGRRHPGTSSAFRASGTLPPNGSGTLSMAGGKRPAWSPCSTRSPPHTALRGTRGDGGPAVRFAHSRGRGVHGRAGRAAGALAGHVSPVRPPAVPGRIRPTGAGQLQPEPDRPGSGAGFAECRGAIPAGASAFGRSAARGPVQYRPTGGFGRGCAGRFGCDPDRAAEFAARGQFRPALSKLPVCRAAAGQPRGGQHRAGVLSSRAADGGLQRGIDLPESVRGGIRRVRFSLNGPPVRISAGDDDRGDAGGRGRPGARLSLPVLGVRVAGLGGHSRHRDVQPAPHADGGVHDGGRLRQPVFHPGLSRSRSGGDLRDRLRPVHLCAGAVRDVVPPEYSSGAGGQVFRARPRGSGALHQKGDRVFRLAGVWNRVRPGGGGDRCHHDPGLQPVRRSRGPAALPGSGGAAERHDVPVRLRIVFAEEKRAVVRDGGDLAGGEPGGQRDPDSTLRIAGRGRDHAGHLCGSGRPDAGGLEPLSADRVGLEDPGSVPRPAAA